MTRKRKLDLGQELRELSHCLAYGLALVLFAIVFLGCFALFPFYAFAKLIMRAGQDF